MAKDGLHALELGELIELNCSLGIDALSGKLGMELRINICAIKVSFLRGLPN